MNLQGSVQQWSVLVENKKVEESTHHNLHPTDVAAVEAEGHHVGLAVHVTCAVLVIEV